MKKAAITLGICLVAIRVWSYTFVDSSNAPDIPFDGLMGTIADLERLIDTNGRNYPPSFIMANQGGFAMGDATLGNFPHFYLGVSGTLGCGNMKFYDEKVARQESVYPAYSPNLVLTLGVGLAKRFDILGKVMLFNDIIYKPDIDQKSVKLDKFTIASAGARVRYNIVKKKELMPRVFDFGGLTFAFGFDYMEGDIGASGQYKYTMSNVFLSTPAPGYYTLKFDAYYKLNLKWYMLSQSAHLHAYFDFIWIFSFYTGLGYSLNYGFIRLQGQGLGLLTDLSLANRGYLTVYSHNRFTPRLFAGILTLGLEINIFFVKLNFESQVNISNGQDINLQVATRFQF